MTQARKILLAGAGEELRLLVDRALGLRPDVRVEQATSTEAHVLNGRAISSDVLLVELDARSANETDGFARLASAIAQRKVIAAARHASPEDVRRLFRAGAADVITTPFTPAALQAAVDEVLGESGGGRAPGRVVSLLKAGGGVGATTMALNLAALAARAGRKSPAGRSVAVLDLDLQFGDADLALNLEPRSSVVDVLRAEARFDGRLLQSAMIDHPSGLRLLAAPPKLIPIDALNAGFAERIVAQSAQLHDDTFIDLPGAWTDWTLPVLRHSSLVVLVGLPTVAGAFAMRRVLDALEEAGVETPTLLVLNKLAGVMEAFEKPSRIGRSLNRNVDATLSLDATAARASDRGVLLTEAYPNARLTRELRGLAGKMDPMLERAMRQSSEFAGAAA